MAQEKTPGVYIVEKNAFPNSVVEVATAVPAFAGYTEKARRGNNDLTNTPTRISSLAEFHLLFGFGPKTTFTIAEGTGKLDYGIVQTSHFHLYHSMRIFFDNGGGPCWIVSVGDYGDAGNPRVKSANDFKDIWTPLKKEQEPTMVVIPDAVLLSQDDYTAVCTSAFSHCTDMRSRVAILDVYNGNKARTYADDDVISGKDGFRNVIQSDFPSYGMAYYPWVNTNIVAAADINYTNIDSDGITVLTKVVKDEQDALAKLSGKAVPQAVNDKIDEMAKTDATPAQITSTHQALMTLSGAYKEAMTHILELVNVLPPSGAMAGVFTRTDNNFGVFKAPANTGIASVMSPTVPISHEDQEDLNVPLDGKAINAIRTFLGRGVLVWGARTLDGNSQDWRYINVRRTLIMLEQSISFAAQSYVFAANDSGTWLTVKTMIENFLNNQWKAGALVGTKPADAYDVSVGLGSTMTGNDILDGYMRVTVRVAVVHPAEFIVITFQQKMQTS